MDDDEAVAAFFKWIRPAFHADAACREHPEVNFFPGQGGDASAAVAVCSRCLVRTECLSAAIDGGEAGVWGGLTPAGRRRLVAA